MYKLFSRNLHNYIKLNSDGIKNNEVRMQIVEPLKGLADIELYNEWKKNNNEKFEEVCNLVYEIEQRKDEITPFETFSWELWGYDFDSIKNLNFSRKRIIEQIKLVDLLLGTHYWI